MYKQRTVWLRVLGVLLGLSTSGALRAQETVTFAGQPWTENMVLDFMDTYLKQNPSYRSDIVKPGWTVSNCKSTPYKKVSAEHRYCFDGALLQKQNGCQMKEHILVVVTPTEETLVYGLFPTEVRCGMTGYNAANDAGYILYPVKILRAVEDTTGARVIDNAHALTFTSAGRQCFGFRDYGETRFTNGYAFTSTGHTCRRTDNAAYTKDEMSKKISALKPDLGW